MQFIVAYDIADNKRRYRVFRALKGYGVAAQESVFECDIDHKRLAEMTAMLRKYIVPSADSIKIYPLCRECFNNASVIGLGHIWRVPDTVIC